MTLMPRTALVGLLTAAIVAQLALHGVAAPASGAQAPASRREVYPVPQSRTDGAAAIRLPEHATVVGTSRTDPAAIAVVRQVLTAAGLAVTTAETPPRSAGRDLVVHVGGPSENPGTAAVLTRHGVDGPEGLAAGGYVFVSRLENGGTPVIALSGVDAAGTFYAAQTLRQLVWTESAAAWVTGTSIRDWPESSIRGGAESFYGPGWSRQDELRQMDFLAAHKANAFLYTPAADPRASGAAWDSPYPAEELAQLAAVVERGRSQHVDFIYRINPEAQLDPEQGICHGDDADLAKLVARYEQLWSIGIRTVSVGWDDVNGRFQCALDDERFGADASPLAAAQAHVVNYVQEHFVANHPGARLITVPTEYWGTDLTPYKQRFRELVPSSVVVYWTGPQVVSPRITAEDLRSAREVWAPHDLLIFDNYPVNDYVRGTTQQHLGPLVNRDPSLPAGTIGLTANEMNEHEASLISLFTVADYTWNPRAYDPARSWDASLREFGGPAYPALRTYAELSSMSPLDVDGSFPLPRLIDDFRTAFESGQPLAIPARRLREYLGRVAAAPATLRARLGNPRFLEQSAPHLDKLVHDGETGLAAVDLLTAHAARDLPAAWQARIRMESAAGRSDAIREDVAPGVFERLEEFAREESDRQLGTSWRSDVGAVSGTPLPASGATLAAAADGDVTTAYRAGSVPGAADALSVDLTSPHPLRSVTVLQDVDHPVAATVEAKNDQGTWVPLGRLDGAVTRLDGRGVVASAVRLSWNGATAAPVVHEIVPLYRDVPSATLTAGASQVLVEAATAHQLDVTVRGLATEPGRGELMVQGPPGWTVTPATAPVELNQYRTTAVTRSFAVTAPAEAIGSSGELRLTATLPGQGRSTTVVRAKVGRAADGRYDEAVRADEPVGYWRLDEPSGETARDTSAAGNHGTYVEPVGRGAAGALKGDSNAAVRMSGGYLNVPSSATIALTGPFTLEAWVRPAVGGRELAIVEKYDTPYPNGYVLRIGANGKLHAWVNSATASYGAVGRTTVTTGEWHHVAAVYDGGRLTIYLDGLADGSAPVPEDPGAGGLDLRIGARGDDTANRFDGEVDEVAVYPRPLDPDRLEGHVLRARSSDLSPRSRPR